MNCVINLCLGVVIPEVCTFVYTNLCDLHEGFFYVQNCFWTAALAPNNLSSLPVINWHHYADAHHRAKFYLFLIIVIQALIICRLLFYYIGTFNIYFFLHMCVPLFSKSYLSRCTLGLLPFYSQSLVQNWASFQLCLLLNTTLSLCWSFSCLSL